MPPVSNLVPCTAARERPPPETTCRFLRRISHERCDVLRAALDRVIGVAIAGVTPDEFDRVSTPTAPHDDPVESQLVQDHDPRPGRRLTEQHFAEVRPELHLKLAICENVRSEHRCE